MANAATAKYVIRLEDKTKRAFKAIGRSLKSVTRAIFSMKTGFITAAGIAGIGFFVKKSMDATDEMAKMSRAIGVSVEELQSLRHAAALGGLQATQLDKAVQKLAINMADMSRGVGLAKDVFEKHNISVKETDGSLRSVMDVMDDVADVTAAMTNETEKADLAYKLFGARGAKMINMLNGGSDAMRSAMAEAEKLGLVMSAETAQGVEDANDALTRLGAFLTSTFTRAVAELAPMIERVTEAIINFIDIKVTENGGVGKYAKQLANAIIDATVSILIALENAGNGIIEFVNKIKAFVGMGQRPMQDIVDDINNVQQSYHRFLNGHITVGDVLQNVASKFTNAADATGYYTNMLDELHAEKKLVEQSSEKLFQLDLSWLRNTIAGTAHLINETNELTESTEKLAEVTKKAADPTIWDHVTKGFESYKQSVQTGAQFIASTTGKLFQGVEDAIMGMITGVKFSWKGLFKAIMTDLIRIQVKKAILGVATSIFGFAAGGRPPVGRPSIVGERGAELFVPDSVGTIIPNHELGGSTKNTSAEINFNVQAIDAASFNTFLVNNRDTIESIINNSLLTNGSVRRTIQMVG
jgi:hypothetical protein